MTKLSNIETLEFRAFYILILRFLKANENTRSPLERPSEVVTAKDNVAAASALTDL